ncbi:hypothetical protein SD70_31335 [Gordoniibacillus kamchatkensis]|uniref:DUF58 domain-containing protein n=1 Tax=Gordoniibacillus kamchatkensis TaxID=1590651 RepID=A0ABR5A734_9BACL|nr:hypothetical protein [Paenibacillus sp. VKM B-2647]KIL36801.1 hypothetical protein SD70_31335 [Paenibacillus sp. VKM B-2647]
MKKNVFWIGLALFGLFLALSFYFESTVYLYIASVLPVLFVPFLPDFGSNQYIKPGKHPEQVEIVRVSIDSGASPLLLIRFRPGYLQWNKKWLYFSIHDISSYPTLPISADHTASLSVLQHDLRLHPRQRGWVGIRLDAVKERTRHMSFTLNEINRIVIRAEDVQALLPSNVQKTASRSKSLQA